MCVVINYDDNKVLVFLLFSFRAHFFFFIPYPLTIYILNIVIRSFCIVSQLFYCCSFHHHRHFNWTRPGETRSCRSQSLKIASCPVLSNFEQWFSFDAIRVDKIVPVSRFPLCSNVNHQQNNETKIKNGNQCFRILSVKRKENHKT